MGDGGPGRRVPLRALSTILPLLLFRLLTSGTAAGAHEPSRETDRKEAGEAREFMRGVVVSCPRYGQIWGAPEMSESLVELERLGVGWIAIHPYAGVRRTGEIRWQPAAETGYLDRAVELVRASGHGLFWKPHLAYWGSFSWRGDIDFGDDQQAWRRFFDGYREFIVDQARFAQAAGATLFAVGVELDRTTARESEWRRVIAEIRQVYHGRITYAANWDSLDRVSFWDAMDLIGVHAYFPLVEGPDPDPTPGPDEIARSWDRHLTELGALASRFDKPVVLAEIGYSRSKKAALEPWEADLDDSPEALELRRRLMEFALIRLERESFIEGMFWWKWMPGPARWDRDFSMKDPEARHLLATYWGRDTPPDAAPAATPSGD